MEYELGINIDQLSYGLDEEDNAVSSNGDANLCFATQALVMSEIEDQIKMRAFPKANNLESTELGFYWRQDGLAEFPPFRDPSNADSKTV